MLLALFRPGGFLEGVGETLLSELGAPGHEALFIGFFRWENWDDIVLGVGLVALEKLVRYLPGTFIEADQVTHL
jgi:hypothetical protein